MHPDILRQLAANHIRDLVTDAKQVVRACDPDGPLAAARPAAAPIKTPFKESER